MGIKVGINGFGRIGRMVFRAGLKHAFHHSPPSARPGTA